jgi:uncharacterized protein
MANVSTTTARTAMTLTWVCFWLLVVGGINWLLVGAFRFDLVAALLGADSMASRLVYVLVGISAIYCAVSVPALGRSGRTI